MQINRDLANSEIEIINNSGSIISKLYFIPSYFIWEFSSDISKNNPIILSKDDNEFFYKNLEWLMKQEYLFPHKYSIKLQNKLIWLSEHCFDLEDEYERDITSRLIIEKMENFFVIYFSKPFIEKNNLPNNGASISFAPAGNGYLTKNIITGTSLQDDIINLFYHTLNNKKISSHKVLKRYYI